MTDQMQIWTRPRLERLAEAKLSGYILKSDSPSCGTERGRVYRAGGVPTRDGVGIYARMLSDAAPLRN